MTDNPVRTEMHDDVLTVTLNRPDARNPLSEDVRAGLRDAVEDVNVADARCMVIRGAGEAFCAGGDIKAMRRRLQTDIPGDELLLSMREINDAVHSVAAVPIPTIAAIDGAAVGGGASLALACDLQIASEEATFSFGFRAVGLNVDTGTSHLLPQMIGRNLAKELVFTGQVVDADRAESLGLVNHVYPKDAFDDEVDQISRDIASGPTVALRNSKRLLDQGPDMPLDWAMEMEATAQGVAYQTADFREGVEAFLEGREPSFEGR